MTMYHLALVAAVIMATPLPENQATISSLHYSVTNVTTQTPLLAFRLTTAQAPTPEITELT